MKTLLKRTVAWCLVLITLFTFNLDASATQPELEDVTLTQAQLDELLENANGGTAISRANDLINTWSLGATKDGTKLIIYGDTICMSSVTKCGFKELVIQRRLTSQYAWSEYAVYEDLYDDDSSYLLGKSVTVPSGYQYRVTGVHYAKKSLLVTQKIENTSNIVWI